MHGEDFDLVVGDRGRVVLPAKLREKLQLRSGSHLLAHLETDGTIHLKPYRLIAEKNEGLLAHLKPKGRSIVDELIQERRAKAAREVAKDGQVHS